MTDHTNTKVRAGIILAIAELRTLEHADSSRLGPMGKDDDWRYRALLARVEATQSCIGTLVLLAERGPRELPPINGGFTVEVYGKDGWQRSDNDGRVSFQTGDGRRFLLEEKDGALTLISSDGEILLHPISRTQVGIETPSTRGARR